MSVGRGVDLGGIVVIPVSDGWAPMDNAVFPDLVATWPEGAAGGTFTHTIEAFLIRLAGRTLLLDTGSAGNFGRNAGRFRESLAATGVRPEEIDTVILSHMHSDHFGGLLSDSGSVAFPAARLVLSSREWRGLQDGRRYDALPESERRIVEHARTTVAAYGSRIGLVGDGDEIGPGIRTLALPGHTPGHMGLVLRGALATAGLLGDIMHCADYQLSNPGWSVIYDDDPAQAAVTRRVTLARAASLGWLIGGAHFSAAGLCRVMRVGEGFVRV